MQSVICINVGGMVNLVDFFDLTNNPNTKWWVFDSHRPLNLHNLFASPQVVVIDDGTIADDIKGLKVAFESIEVSGIFRLTLCSLNQKTRIHHHLMTKQMTLLLLKILLLRIDQILIKQMKTILIKI